MVNVIKHIFHGWLSLPNLFLCRDFTLLPASDLVAQQGNISQLVKKKKKTYQSVELSFRRPACWLGRSYNLRLLHIPLHGPGIMFINGLATGVHSGADNIVATATQYPAGGLE